MSLDIGLYVEVDTGGKEPYFVSLFSANYTGNVCPMWTKAGVYEALYDSDGVEASAIIPILDEGIQHMLAHPVEYRKLNPPNGWGNYEGALKFLQNLVSACYEHPKTLIGVWK